MLLLPDRDRSNCFVKRGAGPQCFRDDLRRNSSSGLTLIELVVVLALIGILTTFATWRLGNFSFWREESFIRRFSETLIFLHHQAVFDQMYYALEIDLTREKRPVYRVGVFFPDYQASGSGPPPNPGGMLSEHLAFFLNPSVGQSQSFAPSPTFPSLADPVEFPDGMYIEDIRTMRGKQRATEGGKVYVMFSPRGFSEFAVFHLRNSKNAPITVLVNPFTGNTELIREYKDFEWNYGNQKSQK